MAGWAKAVGKKLRQIEQLKALRASGVDLNDGQARKVARESELRAELTRIATTPADARDTASPPPAPAAAHGPAVGAAGKGKDGGNPQFNDGMVVLTQSRVTVGGGKARKSSGSVANDGVGVKASFGAGAAVAVGDIAQPKKKGKNKKPKKRKIEAELVAGDMVDIVAGEQVFAAEGPSPPRTRPPKKKRMRGPGAAAAKWIERTVAEKGPIAASMLGRLFQQEHNGLTFKHASGSSLAKWLDDPPIDLDIRDLKGNELLVSAPAYADDVGTAADGTTGQSESRLARRLAVLKERGAEPPTVCGLFNKSDRVLAVGEGDFSWSASVARTGCLLTATSLDSASEVLRKHGDRAAKALAALSKAPGAVVRHGFDATTPPPPVGQHGRRYDFVVFNFPHTGSDEGLDASIKSNRKLVQRFVAASAGLLSEDGELHIALVHRYPYTCWMVGQGLGAPALRYCGSLPFDPAMFPGYKHVTTSMDGRDSRYELEDAETHVFRRK